MYEKLNYKLDAQGIRLLAETKGGQDIIIEEGQMTAAERQLFALLKERAGGAAKPETSADTAKTDTPAGEGPADPAQPQPTAGTDQAPPAEPGEPADSAQPATTEGEDTPERRGLFDRFKK